MMYAAHNYISDYLKRTYVGIKKYMYVQCFFWEQWNLTEVCTFLRSNMLTIMSRTRCLNIPTNMSQNRCSNLHTNQSQHVSNQMLKYA